MNEKQETWTVAQLAWWDERIRAAANDLGLTPLEIDFRILDWEQMVDFSSYGMPYHYRHWSFGKEFDISRIAKRYEVHGLPYEMVVNTDPTVAVLWRDNNLVIQILVMAHVYGHSDFYANNSWFQKMTQADRAEDTCRVHGREIADFNADPSIPNERVEELLTAAHALRFHRPRTPDYVRESRPQQLVRQIKRFRELYQPREWDDLKPKTERAVPPLNLDHVPLEPDEDLLNFLADYAPLQDWERRILRIVAAESDRIMATIGTKIMNEGWATYWNDQIVRSLSDLPDGFVIEYARAMAAVTQPRPFGINPYWLGLALWRDIYRRYESPDPNNPAEADLPGGQGMEMLRQIRQTDCDASFIAGYLSDRLIADLRLFSFIYEGDHLDEELYRITDVPDREGFERIRRKLIATVGINSRPVIRVVDANIYTDRTLHLEHVHDGRDLKLFKPDAPLRVLKDKPGASLSDIQHVMRHIHTIWRNPIRLTTRYDGTKVLATCDREGVIDIKTS